MIINAAIRKKDGRVFIGRRHHEIINAHGKRFFQGCVQGFITNTGEFVDRVEAAKIAYECGQIEAEKKELFSEDLW